MDDILLIVAISSQFLASLYGQYIKRWEGRGGEGPREKLKAPEKRLERIYRKGQEVGEARCCGWCIQTSDTNREGFVC